MKYYYYWLWCLRLKPYYINLTIKFKKIYYYFKPYYFNFFKGITFKIGCDKT
jgi:hypothetical protein